MYLKLILKTNQPYLERLKKITDSNQKKYLILIFLWVVVVDNSERVAG